jgi:hypothetical protein
LKRIFSEFRDIPGRFFRKFAFSFMQPNKKTHLREAVGVHRIRN